MLYIYVSSLTEYGVPQGWGLGLFFDYCYIFAVLVIAWHVYAMLKKYLQLDK